MRDELENFLAWCKTADGAELHRYPSEPGQPKALSKDEINDTITQYFDNFSLYSHPHVEFVVADGNEEKVFPCLAYAVEFALKQAIKIGVPSTVEVIIYSQSGLDWFVEDNDADVSNFCDDDLDNGFVFQRIEVGGTKVEVKGTASVE